MNDYRHYADACIERLQYRYNEDTRLWDGAGWWNNANILEAVIDYASLTKTNTYDERVIANTFDINKFANELNGRDNFCSHRYYDDQLWWALTWIKAYDLTRHKEYLDMAVTIFKDAKPACDTDCGGGIWWERIHETSYKNTITNELFLTAAPPLHLPTGENEYLFKMAISTREKV